MTEKQFFQKLSEVECLREHSVFDVIMSEIYLRKIDSRLGQQKQLRQETLRLIEKEQKLRLPAHTVDRFLKHTAEEFRDEYISVLAKTSKRSAAERKYIEQLGNLAYNDAVEEMACEECPELKEEFAKRRRNGIGS